MGIHDREYYRTEPSGGGLLGGSAPVCTRLIAVTVVVFVAQLLTARAAWGGVTGWLGLDYDSVVDNFQLWRLVTYAFCHAEGDLFHILFNMLGLWFFGPQLEAMYGSREFLRFYLASAAVAGICYLVLGAVMAQLGLLVGASGAVMAVMMVYAIFYPRQRITIMFIIPIEMRWLVGLFVVFNLYPILLSLGGNEVHSNVAYAAHLGGLLYGYLYQKFDLRFQHWLPAWRWPGFRKLARSLPRKNPEVKLYRPPDDADLERRVDEILAKITAQGEASLTDSERQTLRDASDRYKKR